MKSFEPKVYSGNKIQHFEKEGMKQIPEMWEDGQRVPIDKEHFEWWYFDAELDDGSVLVIIFGPKPYFDTHSPTTPLIIIDYTDPKGTTTREFYLEKKWKKNYSSSQGRCEVRIKDNYFIGDLKTYEIKAATKTIVAEIKLENLTQLGKRTDNGFLYFQKNATEKEKYFAWFPSVPFGKVSGSLTINGKKRQITGHGYHDHNWGNADPSSLFNHWYWARTRIGDYILLTGNLVTKKEYNFKQKPFVLLLDKKNILASDPEKLTVSYKQTEKHPKSKKMVSNLLAFNYDDDKIKFTLNLQRNKDLVLQSLLLGNSPHLFLKQIGKNPWYHRFVGKAELVLEKDGKKEHCESTVIYELMYFGKNFRM